MNGIVYMLKHLSSGRIYIGQTRYSLKEKLRFIRRYKNELGELMRRSQPCDFSIKTLVVCKDAKTLNKMERHFIAVHKSTDSLLGFNKSRGGGMKREIPEEDPALITMRMPPDLVLALREESVKENRSPTKQLQYILSERYKRKPRLEDKQTRGTLRKS